MFKKLLILTSALLLLVSLLTVLPVHGESEIYNNVLRLHVIANSDSEEDQALKLSVRDKILSSTSALFENCKTKDEARATVLNDIELIEQIATEHIRAQGYDYPVVIELGQEKYPTKNYESCCFPAGEYLSLQIKIGAAKGKNWWCVLFPPMCLSAASDGDDAFIQAGLTGEQYNIITQTDKPKYKVRFKILEAFNK